MPHRFVLVLLALFVTAVETKSQLLSLDDLPPCNFTSEITVDNLRVGAVLLNMETGQGCAENLDTIFPVASVPKLFIAGAFLEKVAANEADLEDTVTFTHHYFMGDNNACLQQEQLDQSLPLGYLNEVMIACSDNAATWMMMDMLGWQSVQNYINRLGIANVGPVIPYSEVDRLKLAYLDGRWANVPQSIVSRFYRRNPDEALVRQYFDEMPRYTPDELALANAAYFERYNYNTATPRALAEYILKLSRDLQQPDTPQAEAAHRLFDVMLLTQRQYSVQAAPGTVFAGAKNGSDYGLWAEANILYTSLETRIPQAIVIMFLQQTDFDTPDLQRPWNPGDGVLNQYLRSLSPQIMAKVFPEPDLPPPADPLPTPFVIFHSRAFIENCWEWYVIGNFEALDRLDACWRNLEPVDQIGLDEQLGFGLVFYDLDRPDTRFTFIYSAPGGQRYSYQQSVLDQEDAPAYWYRHLDETGEWQIDIFRNLHLVHSQTIKVVGPEATEEA